MESFKFGRDYDIMPGCCGGSMRRFVPLYEQCMRTLARDSRNEIFVNWLMALLVARSAGNGYFQPGSELLQERLKEIPFTSASERKEFLRYITISIGPAAGRVPKFRYDPLLWRVANLYKPGERESKYQRYILRCKWGVAQMTLFDWLQSRGEHDFAFEFGKFVRDELLQMRLAAALLDSARKSNDRDVSAMFSSLLKSDNFSGSDECVEIIHALNGGFGEMLTSVGLPLRVNEPGYVAS